MMSTGENPKHGNHRSDCRQFAVDENSHLLENGIGSANYDEACMIDGGQPRDTFESLMASACSLGTATGQVARRHFSHACVVVKITIMSHHANFLLVFVPFALMAGQFKLWSPVVIFSLNLVAVAPLGTTSGFGIEQLSMSLNDSFGNLLMTVSGNVTELIICIMALKEGRIEVVQSTILGSILVNLLLVMGFSFFFGGIVNMRDQSGEGVEQNFASVTARTTRSFMTMSIACLAFPASLYSALSKADLDDREHSILVLSRGTAIVLLDLYFMYLWFQLSTHPDLFSTQMPYEEDRDERPTINVYAATFLVVLTTYLTVACAGHLVGCLNETMDLRGLNINFVAIILIPAVSNAAEHVTAIHMAIRNKMDLAMGIAAGSCVQVSLFTSPLLTFLGWAVLDKPMTLRFETFQTMALIFAVLVAYTAQDGRSNYLQGAMMIGLYIIIALAFHVEPSDALDKASCVSSS